MKKDIKYIIKRIIIGVGIALLLILVKQTATGTGIIINVKAEENPYYAFTDPDNSSIVESVVLTNNGVYSSNFMNNEKLEELYNPGNNENGAYDFAIFGLDIDSNNIYQTDTYYHTSIGKVRNTIQEYGYIDRIRFQYQRVYGTIGGLIPDTYYSIIFKIMSDGDIKGNQELDKNKFNLNMTLGYEDTQSNTYNWYDIKNIEYITNESDLYDNEFLTYIKIGFKTRNLDNMFGANDNYYYLKSIELSLNNTSYDYNDVVDVNNYNYFYKATGENVDATLGIEEILLVMDADTIIVDQNFYEDLYGVVGSNLNETTCPVCEGVFDLQCHLERIICFIQSIVKNLIYSIKNLFEYIFIPNMQTLSQQIGIAKALTEEKWPFIIEVKDFFEYVVGRFTNIEPKHNITFSGVSMPGYEGYLIPPFTYDFDTLLQNPTIMTMWGCARLVNSFIVIIGFYYLCFDIVTSIFYNTTTSVELNRR